MKSSGRATTERVLTTTATPWSFGYWFAFTYLPPASLVGWEASMR